MTPAAGMVYRHRSGGAVAVLAVWGWPDPQRAVVTWRWCGSQVRHRHDHRGWTRWARDLSGPLPALEVEQLYPGLADEVRALRDVIW